MKVGILTFHRSNNYGAILQCYALYTMLKQLGYDVCVIDYRLPAPKQEYRPLHWIKGWHIRFYLGNIYLFFRKCIYRILISKYFNDFRTRYLYLTKPCTQSSIPQDMDIYLIGSDQVWSLECTHGFDPVYWGQFKHPLKSKIYGYAISTNIASMKEIDKNVLRNCVNQFSILSIREKTIKDYLQNYCPASIRVDVDPTLLLPSQSWDKLTDDSWSRKNDYIVVYEVRNLPGKESLLKDKARVLASQMGITDIINLSTYRYTPKDFVSIIKHARYVLTTSFHGTVFGLIFHKPMMVFKLNDGHDVRCTDLLEATGMSCLLKDIDYAPLPEKCDYNLFDERLQILRQSSVIYLKSLKNEINVI